MLIMMMIMFMIKCDHGDNANNDGDSDYCVICDDEHIHNNDGEDVDNKDAFPLDQPAPFIVMKTAATM